MILEKTLKVLRRLSSVSDPGPGVDDALLVGDIELVVRVLNEEIRSLRIAQLDPRFLIALSKFNQTVGDEHLALSLFKRAATFIDQNRGFYSDIGFCSVHLCRESKSEEFCAEVRNTTQKLLDVAPFHEDLRRALGQD